MNLLYLFIELGIILHKQRLIKYSMFLCNNFKTKKLCSFAKLFSLNIKIKLLMLVFFCTLILNAQQTPGAKENESITIKGGTAHIGNGTIIKNAVIIMLYIVKNVIKYINPEMVYGNINQNVIIKMLMVMIF